MSTPWGVEVYEEVLIGLDGFVVVLHVQHEDALLFGDILKWEIVMKPVGSITRPRKFEASKRFH